MINPISVKPGFLGTKYYQSDKSLTIKQLNTILSENENTNEYLDAAKNKYSTSVVFSSAGGWLIGWPIGYAIGSKKSVDLSILSGGFLIAGIGVHLEKKAAIDYKKAIDIYNEIKP
ncbi:MAG: hypothetical protein HQ510_09740 [Candidatus Marinimicrobia bacterium]|nr:hypothetical protein [Candidatus Neomarinimicrobiota bacterium]